MHKRGTLTSIPELDAEEDVGNKWVPKKKHEVLKAKYKCLKKLFQIYDASVIGILPEQNSDSPRSGDEAKGDGTRRRKRSHRTKTDACAGTSEITTGDNNSAFDNTSIATGFLRELTVDQSCISTQIDAKIDKFAETIDETYTIEKNLENECHLNYCHCQNLYQKDRLFKENQFRMRQVPFMEFETRKLTRFQCFIQRLFGIRKEAYKPEEKMYATSDPVLTCKEKRRRRGLRFRRIKRAKKVRSDSALRDVRNPSILLYVQSVQRQCLMDTTPRKCPINGCNMISYGIINYNDHLNLCHFKDRKYICHYCHEGFEIEHDKLLHENEHIGIGKLGVNTSTLSSVGQAHKMATDTQTEPDAKIPEDKLKKIVSFFDKISDTDQMLSEIKKSRSSDTNLPRSKDIRSSGSSTERSECEQAHSASCCTARRARESEPGSVQGSVSSRAAAPAHHTCRFCEENFSCRRQLSLHVSTEHCAHERFTKYHSCAGIVRPRADTLAEEGSINVRTGAASYDKSLKRTNTETTLESVSKKKSNETFSSCNQSNVVYYSSTESLENKPSESVVDSLMQKVRSYRWEPGTKILRV